MNSDNYSPPSSFLAECCDSGSPLMDTSHSDTCFRSLKRKHDEGNKFVIPGLDLPHVARVEIENEVDVLRETVGSQQLTIQDLNTELEEERDASSSAANEAMSMILRLEKEKAEIQMEARQFKRFAEERIAHDQKEILALEDLLYKREQTIQSLTCEVQAYKHRIMSYGLTEAEADGEGPWSHMMSINNFTNEVDTNDVQFDFPACDYPPLKCNLNANHNYTNHDYEVEDDVEKYAFGDTPQSRDQLKDLEFRINQLERTPTSITHEGDFFCSKNVTENVTTGQSPRRPMHLRKFSSDSAVTFLKETVFTDSPKFRDSTRTAEYSQKEEVSTLWKVDSASEVEDNVSDRVYTIDSVPQGAPYNRVDYVTHREAFNHADFGDPEIKKLYMRLQTLEADRESMRQALISMRTDKAQFVLLKEIAQQLRKEMPPVRAPTVKPSLLGSFSIMSILKLALSFVFWKKKPHRCRYMFGLSPHHIGLLMLLDKGPHIGQWRCLSSVQL
ncbi:hypothetical protein LIER_34033 [Lithospermum erythrorhizon]|uniref:GTD-binding domain-containing protein n=1 Tax=Lithospermum erythrorhizon TaxID=34254 RepID=A0AAV3S0T4_LITER